MAATYSCRHGASPYVISKEKAQGAGAPAVVASQPLVVGSEQGLRELGTEGQLLRRLSSRPARRPRLLQGGRAVLFLSLPDTALWRVDRETGRERRVAQLPPQFIACTELADYAAGHRFELTDLDVQEDSDFVVDRSGRAACIVLKDRNTNMMNFEVALRIDLARGAVEHLVTYPEKCAHGRRLKPCRPLPAKLPPGDAARKVRQPFTLEGGKLKRDAGKTSRVVAELGKEYELEGEPSADGRWQPVCGPIEQGDHIHRPIFLLDRQQGRLYAVKAGPASPLTATQIATLGRVETFDAVGETTIRWSPDGERLVLDSLLVLPGVKGIELKGDIALP